ncbi:4Fe-4S dicluster domain-containing protein [Pseudodesulfovibrio methanolicus]|uniref:4Fe-4S dicluster domain-containing protein n=1 Tax=Pseudodesulfovibrio methanolicus TaxID=3126690 RepID=A0ABZ2J4M3_9BACT
MPDSLQKNDKTFLEEVERRSGQHMVECYQCGNCTAGCPFNFAYDLPVSKIMRLVQLGQREAVLSCHSIWLCASCQTCTARCPNNIDVAKIVDVLRHMAREAGYATERNVKAFGDSFLASVKKHGRLHELGVAVGYEMRTGRFLTDIDLAPTMIGKGKLSIRPHHLHGADKVAGIFNRFNEGNHD